MEEPDRVTQGPFARPQDAREDGKTTGMEEGLVEAHLAACEACAAGHAFDQAVDREIRAKLATITAPPALKLRIQALLAEYSGADHLRNWRDR